MLITLNACFPPPDFSSKQLLPTSSFSIKYQPSALLPWTSLCFCHSLHVPNCNYLLFPNIHSLGEKITGYFISKVNTLKNKPVLLATYSFLSISGGNFIVQLKYTLSHGIKQLGGLDHKEVQVPRWGTAYHSYCGQGLSPVLANSASRSPTLQVSQVIHTLFFLL